MVVISVDVSEKIAKKIPKKDKVISIDELYEYDEVENFKSVKVWEKASVVLDFLKSIK